jgi:membrane fusion protein, multidrug efflux system
VKRAKHGACLLFASLTLTACNDNDPAAKGAASSAVAPNIAVNVQVIRPQPLIHRIQALGTAHANESIDIRPRISSVVARVLFEEDQLVEKDAPLVELENSEIRAELAVAEAELKESESTFNRNRSLKETQVISASNFEQVVAAMEVDRATVNAAKARLAHTILRAPFAGRIGLRRVSPGSFVDTDTVITTLDDTRTIKLDFSVPEIFLPVVAEGVAIEAKSPVYPDRVFKGRVASVDTRVDPQTRAVQVRALIANADGTLKPGMFLTVDLQRDQGRVLMAPEESIVPEGGRQFVYVVTNGMAEKREVTLGRRIPGSVEILSNLSAGESIITEGVIKVRDGAAVDVLQRGENSGRRGE